MPLRPLSTRSQLSAVPNPLFFAPLSQRNSEHSTIWKAELKLEHPGGPPSPDRDIVSQAQMPRLPCGTDRLQAFEVALEQN